jgi:tripartite-type tricarboxylate transporter receptor subunit TctC
MKRRTLIGLAIAMAAGSVHAQAQDAAADYPNRPVRLVVGFAPGGAADLLARVVARSLTTQLGQSFVVENRPGANAAIAAGIVMGSKPDGYTLFVSASGAITLEPHIRKNPRYDPDKAFVPVVMAARFPFVIVAGPSQPFNTGPELVAAAKAQPGKLTYASAGNGSLNNMGGEYFKLGTGTDIVHVPYKGDGASIPDLVSGTVSFNMLTAPVAIPLIQGGRLKAVATMDAVRAPALPDVPTLKEQGMPGFEIGSWIGLFAPAGTPPAIVDKINREVLAYFASPDGKHTLTAGAMSNEPMSPAQFATMVHDESARWDEVAKKAHISLDD